MVNAAKRVGIIVDQNEWRLRLSLLKLWDKQRKGLPYNEIRSNGGPPVTLIQKWADEYSEWFMKFETLWRKMWNDAIKSIQTKTIEQENFDDWLYDRSLTIGNQLANVQVNTIGTTLSTYAHTSWTRLQKELKDCIGLQPRQSSAFFKQSEWILDNYPPDKAAAMIDRLYQKKLNYRAQLVARTELSNGINDSQMSAIKSRIAGGQLPASVTKVWRTREDKRVCPVCLLNENQEVGINDIFNSGHSQPTAHPGCHCGLQYRIKTTLRLHTPIPMGERV